MLQRTQQFWKAYAQKNLLMILCLGFASGLPLSLTASTLFAWLAEVGVNKASIGLFASIATPYSIKFLWSPVMDGMLCPVLGKLFGRRRGWLLAVQIGVAASIASLAFINPSLTPILFAFTALLIAFFSASQDVVIDAYRVEIMPPEQQGAAAAMITFGYRMAMLVSGAGALWLSDNVSWKSTYLVMASLMGVGIFTTLLMPEPEVSRLPKVRHEIAVWLRDYVKAPFADFVKRDGWIYILIFVVLFKLADAFLGVMFNPFLLDLGFSKTQIAAIVKLYGLVATIFGTFIGGGLVAKYGMYRVLLSTTILHMLTNLLLVVQADMGPHEGFLKLCVVTENLTAGMGTAAFVAYLSSLCHAQFTATQYALLSSLASVARTLLSTTSGIVATMLGWHLFFVASSLLALPAIVLQMVFLKKLMHNNQKD